MNAVARIQSFPDSFRLAGPEARQYRALGNAIPPVLSWHVMKSVVEAFVRGERQRKQLSEIDDA